MWELDKGGRLWIGWFAKLFSISRNYPTLEGSARFQMPEHPGYSKQEIIVIILHVVQSSQLAVVQLRQTHIYVSNL